MKKRGQFYLIAALVIVVLLVGFIGLINYTRVEKGDSMKELQKDLDNEITYTLNYGSAKNLDTTGFNLIFKNLSSIYTNRSGGRTSIFLYGKAPGDIVVRGKSFENSNISISINGNWSILKEGTGEFEENYSLNENVTYLNISDNSYTFEFNEGQNFKYFIFQDNGKENFIIQG